MLQINKGKGEATSLPTKHLRLNNYICKKKNFFFKVSSLKLFWLHILTIKIQRNIQAIINSLKILYWTTSLNYLFDKTDVFY